MRLQTRRFGLGGLAVGRFRGSCERILQGAHASVNELESPVGVDVEKIRKDLIVFRLKFESDAYFFCLCFTVFSPSSSSTRPASESSLGRFSVDVEVDFSSFDRGGDSSSVESK